ncbi:BMA-FLN-2, isoform d [Aphelenchoides fujianensis]|nr:BMA-FLN-2, isoform d [Aphelenchoides fujianensis]
MEETQRYVSQLYVIPAVDASEAGKGALEISINQGRVPNNVQLQDAGRCLVTFIPQHAGTYVIDVTFNGATVHGCPIRVDVNAKGVGKPVSAPVVHPHRFEGHSAGVAGSTSPRPPSSAYFSAGSPHVDTSPTSPAYQTRESPRSPSLVAAHTRDRSSDQEERNRAGLRSPRLVHDANTTVGYTVAHYGEGKEQQSPAAPPADRSRRYFGDPTDLRDTPPHSTRTDYRGVGGESTVDSGLGSYSATSPRPHRYFESDVRSSPREPEWRRSGHEPAVPTHPPPPPEDSTQVEMTRSAEVRLYRDAEGATHPTAVKTQGITTYTSPKSGEVPAESGFDYRVTSDSSAVRPQSREHHRRYESPAHYSAPRGEPRPDYAEPPTEETALLRTDEIKAIPLDAAVDRRPVEEEDHRHKRLPSGAGSLTPGTRRKLLEHSVERLKFGSSGRSSRTPGRGFEFGKSKFTSKHEVVRLGKDVEVKLESLKLGKEDQLRVVVTPPSRGRATDDTSTLAIPDLPHRLKKSGKTYEITFKPTEVGTHKVLAFVNDQPHPAAPFPIRVYDASRIIVGEIPAQSVVNDTVEFTADAAAAGFGVLEIAIKDANNIIIPSHVNQLESGMAKFLVTFNPSNVGVHSVNISFNKEQIANSPFRCNIVEAAAVGGAGGFEPTTPETRKKEKAKEKERKAKKDRNGLPNKPLVSKLPSLSRVGKPAAVLVQLPNSADLIQATIVDSAKQNCPAEIFEEEANVRRIEFVPQAVGDHEIALHVNGTEVAGSPFTCRAYDPAAILVGQIPDGVVNKPVHFTVDASSAGVGNLEVDGRPSFGCNRSSGGRERREDPLSSTGPRASTSTTSRSFRARTSTTSSPSASTTSPLEGSPFVCHLLGTQQMRVRASGAGLDRVAVGRAVDFAIEVDDARGSAGVLPQVTITDAKGRPPAGRRVQRPNPNGTRFIAEYTPKAVGNHQVDVAFDGQPIGGSPFSVKAFDASCVRLSLGEPAVVGQPCTFIVDAARAGAGSMELVRFFPFTPRNLRNLQIVSVQDRNVPNFVQAEGQARFKVSFTPQEARDHVISVKFNGINVPGTPLVCPVLSADSAPPPLPTSPPPVDEELRLVGDLAVAQVGRPKGFSIDAPRPNVDCNVIVTGPGKREIPVEVVRVSEGFDVEFTPRHEGDHQIDIRVDGRSLAICPIVCRVSDVDRRKGRVRVGFTISKPGRYSVILRRNGAIVEEHFLAAEPADSNNVAFLSFPERALVDRTARFELELADGLEERLVIEVTDPDGNSVPVSLHRTSGRTFASEARGGPHVVNVRVAGEAVAEAPREVRVLDLTAVQLVGLQNAPVGVQQRFNIDWGQSGGSNTTVKVTYGDNKTVPCQMRRLKNGVDACSFVPAVPGLYLVDVAIDGITLPECPYECMIRDSGSVRALGDALNGAQCGRTARFEVVIGNANQGEPGHPHGSPLPVRCYKQQDNSYWVEFTPEAVGPHVIEATFGDAPLPGSPFHCEVVDPRRVAVHGLDDHLTLRHIAHVTGTPTSSFAHLANRLLLVNRRNAGSGNLEFEIVDPNGVPLKVDRLKNSVDDDSFTFLPIRLGPHSVRLQLAGFPVPGVPKSVDVEEAGRLALQGPAIERAVEVGQPAALLLDTRRQAGGLKIDVRDPDGEKVRHTTNKRADNSTEIVFSPTRVGTHRVAVDFNNKPLGGSALLGGDRRSAQVRDPRGELLRGDEARVESPGRGKFRLLITPRRAGTYKIFLSFADHPVPSANPLLAHVEQGRAPSHGLRTTYASSSHTSFDSTTDHTRVRAYGDGLSRAIVKEPAEFFVDATNAPQAKVTATLNGEKADVPVRLTSVGPHLFKGVYTPLVGGPYELHVSVDERPVRDSPFRVHVQSFKTPADTASCSTTATARTSLRYENEDVPGSPYVFSVHNPPDPTKVRVFGPGIEHGILAKFESNFVVDTRGAGAGQLTVRVRGPKGAFNVEMQRDRQQDRTIHCKYEPKEPGDYQVEVKWHGEHVNGSPFLVLIVDTEEELRRFLSGGAPSPPPALPFLPPGWQGPPHPPMMGGPPMIGPPLIPSHGRRSAPPGMPPPQAIYGRAPRHRF